MTDFISGDNPLSSEKDDKFKRFEYSKRIAETIVKRNLPESIVVGLYGAWGEGKTTVINFVRNEISNLDPTVTCVSFNPWRFSDETALLISFFNSLATVLVDLPLEEQTQLTETKSKVKKTKEPLKTNLESIGDTIRKYAGIVSFINGDKVAETIGTALSNVDLETLKNRVETLLLKHKRKIVIFIDDIDRLDKDEVYSIFRLVKLTANFPYTTYLLSFDESMVAKAISHRFGSNDIDSGIKFLEKIIQVPLRLPQARKEDLKTYGFELVDKALDINNIVISKDEAQEFSSKFSSAFLSQLTTPRLAIRYGNALSFSLPLIQGEVNYVDFLLVEALRIFYPEVYELIRDNSDYFIGNYPTGSPVKYQGVDKREQLIKTFDSITSEYTSSAKENVIGLLLDLFPKLKVVWSRSFHFGSGSEVSRLKSKRISAKQYFNKYFTYSVSKDEVSDIGFNSFKETLKSNDFEIAKKELNILLKSGSPSNLIEKIEILLDEISSNEAIILVKALSTSGPSFPDDGIHNIYWQSPASLSALIIAKLIRSKIEPTKRFEILKWVIKNSDPIETTYKIHNFCRRADDDTESLFDDKQYMELNILLRDRALKESLDSPIWLQFPYESKFIMNAWHQFNSTNLVQYISKWLKKDSVHVISLLKMFTGPIQSNIHPVPYSGDFTTKHFNWVSTFIDPKIIFSALKKQLGSKINKVSKYTVLDNKQTDENIMKQFVYCYQHPDETVQGQFG